MKKSRQTNLVLQVILFMEKFNICIFCSYCFFKLFSKRHKNKSGCKSTRAIFLVLATAEYHGTTQHQTHKNMGTECFGHVTLLYLSKTIDYHHVVKQQKHGLIKYPRKIKTWELFWSITPNIWLMNHPIDMVLKGWRLLFIMRPFWCIIWLQVHNLYCQ